MGSGRFIALEGLDGAGKTTLAQSLAAHRYSGQLSGETASEGLVFVSRRQLSETSSFAGRLMDHAATMLWGCGHSTDLSDRFWVNLQAAWFTAHSETVIAPLLERGWDVIVDGWIYKFWGKLLEQGYERAELATLFAGTRTPDSVVLLDIDIDALYRRRSEFSPTELGMHAGYTDFGLDTFREYQGRGMRNLRSFAQNSRWLTLPVASDETVEVTSSRVSQLLSRHALASATSSIGD
ncbi:hypothetical protein CRM89_25510 [Nocardia sp. FDAARGOS_372]|nr:hypothetical protein CRM89_25510 [Nocardia sp. FDAARGOS_372]